MEHYFTNNDNLKSDFRTIIYKYDDFSLKFTSDLGVFSKDKVDYGSRLLIEAYIQHGKKNVSLLDVGCGYGVIGISLALIMETNSVLIDINKRAVHLAEMNIKANKATATAFLSEGYENVKEKYDVIITNPPIRAGKQTVHSLLENAKYYLNNDGELWFVMRKNQGAKSAIAKLQETMAVDIVCRSNGFYIIVAKKLLTSS